MARGVGIKGRRQFLAASVALGGAAVAQAEAGAAKPSAMAFAKRAQDQQHQVLAGLDAAGLQAELQAGRLSAEALTRHYLKRIEQIDAHGPQLRSVIELNPEALAQARVLDAERRAGKLRGPLHGLPVLVKDNIASADRMATTAGSLGLAGLHARHDAHLIARLRDAGAVLLGKTNLSEWANIRSTRSVSGWSSRGGLTRNPHQLNRNCSGSSSGSGAAAAAGLCALAVGTETDGSIVSPASICGVVGLKPTVGQLSRHGVIPIAAAQDTAGPMTRHVRDAALLMQALAGADPNDAATLAAPRQIDWLAGLKPDALRGARLGIVRASQPPQPQVNALFERALAVLKAQGAELIDGLEIPSQAKYAETELTVLLHELRAGLADYLREFQPDAPFKTLDELVAWNRAHAAEVMPWFDQELFEQALALPQDGAAYREALANNQRYSREEGLDALFAQHRLDAVVAPTGNLAWLTDKLLGDHFTAGGFTTPFAVAGYPHLTVPMGAVAGLPAGLSFGGLAWQDAKLLGFGYAYEQASRARVEPKFQPGL
ncbi:amidase [Paucibacter sp. APW11]|uniref:Amidase n=1 Tax=Roseateles aquae TaxID=3077235 RepID=A0ABU3PGG2_9BURK|nr:amidase [Paucibacter sp. APW11]MDT9001437.1 amidase [Paucibacter sp. APW11]